MLGFQNLQKLRYPGLNCTESSPSHNKLASYSTDIYAGLFMVHDYDAFYCLIVTFLPYGTGVHDVQSSIGTELHSYHLGCSKENPIVFYRQKQFDVYVRMAIIFMHAQLKLFPRRLLIMD